MGVDRLEGSVAVGGVFHCVRKAIEAEENWGPGWEEEILG